MGQDARTGSQDAIGDEVRVTFDSHEMSDFFSQFEPMDDVLGQESNWED